VLRCGSRGDGPTRRDSVPELAARGRGTFRAIADYPHPVRETARVGGSDWDVSELCVVGGVPDILDHVLRVDRVQGDAVLKRLFEK
jgi:hypothetical protein